MTYNATDRRKLAAQGKAMPNADGPPKFPITNRSSLESAIKLHGQVPKPKQPAVRRHIIRNAKKLGLLNVVPDGWKTDGSGSSY